MYIHTYIHTYIQYSTYMFVHRKVLRIWILCSFIEAFYLSLLSLVPHQCSLAIYYCFNISHNCFLSATVSVEQWQYQFVSGTLILQRFQHC